MSTDTGKAATVVEVSADTRRATSEPTELYRERMALWRAERQEHREHDKCVRYGDKVCADMSLIIHEHSAR